MSRAKRSKVIKERGYYCDCIPPGESTFGAKIGAIPVRKVEICEDEICKDCGHYAVYKKVGDHTRGNYSAES